MSQKVLDRRKRNAPPASTEWVGGRLTNVDGTAAAVWLYRGRPAAQRSLDDVGLGEALAELLGGLDEPKRPSRARVEA